MSHVFFSSPLQSYCIARDSHWKARDNYKRPQKQQAVQNTLVAAPRVRVMFSHTCCMVSCIFPNSAVTIDWNISERGGRKQRCCFQIRHIQMGLCHVWRHSLKRVSSLTRHPTKLSKSMVYLGSAYLPITDCRTSVLSWKPGEEKK